MRIKRKKTDRPRLNAPPNVLNGRRGGRIAALAGITAFSLIVGSGLFPGSAENRMKTSADRFPGGSVRAQQEGIETNLLKLLGLSASPESIDYVLNKTQFQLHTLLTEQRHPKTWDLSQRIREDTAAGLGRLLSVDEDVVSRLDDLAGDLKHMDQAVQAAEKAVIAGKKIYIYGCGATGRLAKQMESAFWRPFWESVKSRDKIWSKLKAILPDDIEDKLIGEMTGADRALISSLEGFEDLPIIGRLQLQDRGVGKGDLVIAVTEGGETSSVIGTILAALDQWKAEPGYDPSLSRQSLYFIDNNPDEKLLPFLRSRQVIEEPGITKINLTTGPQAITGSTRMQATTIETYVVGSILQAAVRRILARKLSAKEMSQMGFSGESLIGENFRYFAKILRDVKSALPDLARLTDAESQTYAAGRFSTYFAKQALITVFIDSTERSPTFRLFPLDTIKESRRKCWIQVWTEAADGESAWQAFLGRPFRGLDPGFYRNPFEAQIDDPFLRIAALDSLTRAGNDQADLYDFSFSAFNINKRGPHKGDLGVAVILSPEERDLKRTDSSFRRFIDLFRANGARTAILLVTDLPQKEIAEIKQSLSASGGENADGPHFIAVRVDSTNDPFGLKRRIAAKILLNAHSTAVMAKLGKVVGNAMTNVSPSNLKLIGRATYLIQSQVNDILSRPGWVKAFGVRKEISYGEANAVLFDAIGFLIADAGTAGQTAEVALSIIRILESLKERRGLTNEEALAILVKKGLGATLADLTSLQRP